MSMKSGGWLLLPSILLLLSAVPCRVSGNSYVVSFPCSIHPGEPTNIGLSVLRSVGRETVVTVRISHYEEVLMEQREVVTSKRHLAIPIQMPMNIAPLVHNAVNLTVSGVGGVDFSNTSLVTVGRAGSVFIQTDKLAYKAGQTVQIRVVAVHRSLMPYSAQANVDVYDALHNKIHQWQNASLDTGLWTGELPLSSQPVLGTWSIRYFEDGMRSSQVQESFDVREYVLPKFEVTLTAPEQVSMDDFASLTVQAKATYTHGRPVRGTVNIQVSLDSSFRPLPPQCMDRGGFVPYQDYHRPAKQVVSNVFVLNKQGEATFVMRRREFTHQLLCGGTFQDFNMYERYKFMANASVMDDVTGEIQWTTAETMIVKSSLTIKFDPYITRQYFQPGALYPVRILVTDLDGSPSRNNTEVKFTLETMTTNKTRSEKVQSLHVRNGVVTMAINVESDVTYMSLKADLEPNVRSTFTPIRFYSPSGNYVSLATERSAYTAGEDIVLTATSTLPVPEFVFMVIARSELQLYTEVKTKPATPTEAAVTFKISPRMAPSMKVLCYYEVNNEMVIDSQEISVSGAFDNNVSIEFDMTRAEPGANVSAIVRAAPGSTVAIGVIDKKAQLLARGNEITVERVEKDLSSYSSSSVSSYAGGSYLGGAQVMQRKKRLALPSFTSRGYHQEEMAASDVLSHAGLCMLTDVHIPESPRQRYRPQTRNLGQVPADAMAMQPPVAARGFMAAGPAAGASFAQPSRVRTNFPETWLWLTGTADSDGIAKLSGQVPDSITTWVGDAFALSSAQGLGVAPSKAQLTAFKPFFITLNLPYSVIRGEELSLQVNLFNYLSDMEAFIHLQSSEELTVVGSSPGELVTKNLTTMQGGAGSVEFLVIAQKAGHVAIDVTARSPKAADRIRRQLLVEAEGVQHSYSMGVLLDLTEKEQSKRDLGLQLPSGIVPDSVTAKFSVIGDIMGPALSNLDQLLLMPSGCGEQNMLGFAPDVFVMKYLTATDRSTGEIAEKATRYMRQGYQRQLTYMHADRSFSAFGKRDPSGSLWLTAFVAKSFAQAEPFIFIDTSLLSQSLHYIVRQQKSDGSFPLVGMVHHQSMKGGLQGEVARTAYVLTALVEAQLVTSKDSAAAGDNSVGVAVDSALMRSRKYLENNFRSGIADNYTLALTAYALGLSGSREAQKALDMLVGHADRSGGAMSWSDARSDQTAKSSDLSFLSVSPARASDIELTAYGLLALLQAKDMASASLVARWLSTQRNSLGGFGSTQDTVVGLQALSELAVSMSSAKQDVNIILSSTASESFKKSFRVTQQNTDVLQTALDIPVPGTLTVRAEGSGYALVTAEVFYNVPEGSSSGYEMSATCSLESFRTGLSAICDYCTAAEVAAKEAGGMSLLEITVPSGFEADVDALRMATINHRLIKRVESPDRRLVLYLDEVPEQKLCVSAHLRQVSDISNVQPVVMRTVNYYQPSVSSALLYNVATVDSCRRAHVTSCPVVSAMDDYTPSSSSTACFSATLVVGLLTFSVLFL
ncbi:CD109 antigen-like [Sycon ciliatum]|uniref:CD109 antigen-like n=1 Tax=Sycon ciliatum TaxID=27933 RepID=UPI0031F5FB0F